MTRGFSAIFAKTFCNRLQGKDLPADDPRLPRSGQERTKAVLHALATKNIHPDATLVTDEHGGYKGTDFVPGVINHANVYVRGQVHTNGIENFWSLLKRSLHGT